MKKEMKEKSGNLFNSRSHFSFEVRGYLIAIVDEGGSRSVTNDMENVLKDIAMSRGVELVKSCKDHV